MSISNLKARLKAVENCLEASKPELNENGAPLRFCFRGQTVSLDSAAYQVASQAEHKELTDLSMEFLELSHCGDPTGRVVREINRIYWELQCRALIEAGWVWDKKAKTWKVSRQNKNDADPRK